MFFKEPLLNGSLWNQKQGYSTVSPWRTFIFKSAFKSMRIASLDNPAFKWPEALCTPKTGKPANYNYSTYPILAENIKM